MFNPFRMFCFSPDGVPDQRAYWLGRARSVRPNGTKPAGRADGT